MNGYCEVPHIHPESFRCVEAFSLAGSPEETIVVSSKTLADQLQTLEVLICPKRVILYHALQSLRRKCVAWGMERDHDPATIGMAIDLVGAFAAIPCLRSTMNPSRASADMISLAVRLRRSA